VVDDEGEEIFADKIGLMLARDLAPLHKGATFIVDVKSTGLYATDPILAENGCKTSTGRPATATSSARPPRSGALAGFEKSGHFFLERRPGPRLRRRPDRRRRHPGHAGPQSRQEAVGHAQEGLPVAYTSLTMSPHAATR
jgi:phosphomannomutase/phosphoglucomutase